MMRPGKLAGELRRFALARSAFSQASALCKHAISLSQASSDLEASLIAGIVVTYSRPFVRNDGVGRLPQSYERFDGNASLEHVHKTAIGARNWVYAHRDNLNSPVLAGSAFPPEKAAHVRLDITDSGYSLLVFEPAIAFADISKFASLLEYQSKRAQADTVALVNAARGQLGLDIGSYLVAEEIKPYA